MTDVMQAAPAPVQLKPELNEEGHVDSSVGIEWCIKRAVTDDLKTRAVNPQLLIVTTHNGVETYRKLVPLLPQWHFLGFHHDGPNQVHAALVWDKDGDTDKLEELFFTKGNDGEWKCPVLAYNHKGLRESFDGACERYPGDSQITLDVDPDLLSHIRFKNLNKWINRWWKTKPRDPEPPALT